MERIAIALLAITVIVSGCVDALDDEPQPETNGEEEPTLDEEEPEATEEEEDSEADEEVNGEESETEETETDEEETNGEEATGEETDSEEIREVVIENDGHSFVQDDIIVEQGETVEITFENTGGNHNLVIPELDVGTGETFSGPGNESFTHTFEETGTFEFVCELHSATMTGTITVV